MSGRSYLSIGDVLTLLRQEFPDVTISKIRFLESQGLVNPERTPSGYRKFYEHDVERLRWVLRQQREHFLPLKVIKDRLDEGTNGVTSGGRPAPARPADQPAVSAAEPVPAPAAEPVLVGQAAAVPLVSVPPEGPSTHRAATPAAPARGAVRPVGTPEPRSQAPQAADRHAADPVRAVPLPGPLGGAASTGRHGATDATPAGASDTSVRGPGPAPAVPPTPAVPGPPTAGGVRSAPAPAVPRPPARAPEPPRAPAPTPPAGSAAEAAAPPPAVPRPTPAPNPTPASPARATTTVPGSATAPAGAPQPATGGAPRPIDSHITLEELATASGLDLEVLGQLREYGLLTATTVGGVEYFDDEAVAVATLAASFARYGVEPRHLRLYKNAADREAGFVEQIILPLVRQRNPEARARALATGDELLELGQGLRRALLRNALRDVFGS